MPEIVKKLINEYENLPCIDVSDFEEALADRDILDKISVRLLNKEANKKMIAKEKLVHYDIEGTDLVALFYLDVVSGNGMIGGAGLNEYMLDEYLPNLTAERLYYEVLYRVKEEDIRFENMKDVLYRLGECTEEEFEDIHMNENAMFLLTNRNVVWGASIILSEVARHMILDKFSDQKLFVIPSSIHEVILIPASDAGDIESLREMVSQVNKTTLSKEQVLSDNVYLYDATIGKLTIVSENEVEEE